ncbi:TlpA family protein disulfide reductase [Hymenobacter cellulosivorans]|uniref:TlpA family protein disulfide reductase n=1 Tax=Hymenobacter cellulosivorans TaxID=2932249 RepID=A0ABY4FC12_9BACT|nr:TlpA disulfide reductase family protein [Hymenobacter cellulosivorans]UOQ54079.1 TlpA family protein disulfide reductase [Hymenobacter cellulosivorans]
MAYSFRSCIPGLLVGALLALPLVGRAQGTVTLTGKISSKTNDTVAVSVRESPLDPKEQITYAKVDNRGEFRLALTVNGPTKADLVYGDDVASLFLEPGNAMEIRFKGKDLSSTVSFKGKGAEANTYLAELDERFVENDGFQVLPDNINLYEAPFLSFLDYRRKEEKKFFENYSQSNDLSPAFKEYAKAEIEYSYANDRLTFQDLREQVVATEGRLKMTPTYYDFLNDKALINNPAALENEQYQEFLINYVHHLAVASNHQRSDPDFYQVCYDMAKNQLSDPVRAVIMGRVLQESFRFGHVKQSAAMLQNYHSIDTKNEYYPVLQHDFETHKAFAIGAPAPDFKLISSTGDSITLHSLRGKLVYINFWRTTSGLSLRDLPYAAELAKKFDGKPIVFLNVALDENEPAWKQLVIGKKLAGTHVRATGGMRSAIARAYAIQDVPAYFLLAEDGTFLNTKPKRLSSRAAVDEIKESFGKASTYSSTLPSSAGK